MFRTASFLILIFHDEYFMKHLALQTYAEVAGERILNIGLHLAMDIRQDYSISLF